MMTDAIALAFTGGIFAYLYVNESPNNRLFRVLFMGLTLCFITMSAALIDGSLPAVLATLVSMVSFFVIMLLMIYKTTREGLQTVESTFSGGRRATR